MRQDTQFIWFQYVIIYDEITMNKPDILKYPECNNDIYIIINYTFIVVG